jgi:general secretion pathway protein H
MSNRSFRSSQGFTLLELLVVVAIMAMATAGVSLAMRDNAQTSLEREAQRLAVLFESARAQSRASGLSVYWRTTPEGFRFDGLPVGSLPDRWLTEGTTVAIRSGQTSANDAVPALAVQLGPEPIVGAQTVDLFSQSLGDGQASRTLRIGTDGLRPFALVAP